MIAFVWTVIVLFLIEIAAKVIVLATGISVPRTALGMVIDVLVMIALVIWGVFVARSL